jgi:hypothetical protein
MSPKPHVNVQSNGVKNASNIKSESISDDMGDIDEFFPSAFTKENQGKNSKYPERS